MGKRLFLSVFDQIERTFNGARPYLMSHFDYLNCSNRPEAGHVRDMIDGWLQRYPDLHREKLRNRLRTVDNDAHLAAFFELVMHEILIRAGCRIVDVEPAVLGSRRVPDFLVEGTDGKQFYLEVATATGRSNAERGERDRC